MTRYKLIRETLHLSKPFISNYTKIKEDKLNAIEYGLIIPTEDEMKQTLKKNNQDGTIL